MAKGDELASGLRLGNYVLSERIGKGAFGEVWKAAHFETPQRVRAIKIATSAAYRHELSREGSLPEIDHPNVVPILDSDTQTSEVPYLVMPYIAGGSLADLLKANPSGLPEERVVGLLKDILAGLAAAHERGIIHRDIKPQNILLAEDGRALVTDFGLSCGEPVPDAMRSVMQSTSLALDQGATLAGTLAYMAPEILDGQTPTPAADVYAVGVLLFEMLVGRRPGGIETPRRARRSLHHPLAWDRLYVRACCPQRVRFADAKAMREAVLLEETRWQAQAQAPSEEPQRVVEEDADSLSEPPLDQLRGAVRVALADGAISRAERHELAQLAQRLGVAPEEVARVVSELLGEARLGNPPWLADQEIVNVLLDLCPDSRIYVAPDIPAELAETARRRCRIPPLDPILGLIDCTLFGSGKDCVALTSRGFYYHNTGFKSPFAPLINRGFVRYEELPQRTVWSGGEHENVVHLGAQRAFNPSAFSKEKLCALLSALRARVQKT